MLKQLKKNKSEGFTIIEVMIVLAIAGLILLIVFLAVPALQRNSRNTQRKSDVGRINAAANEVLSNNNGQITALTTGPLRTAVGTPGFYTNGNISAATPLASGGTLTNSTSTTKVVVVPNGKCDGANAAYSYRRIATLYSVESGSGGTTRVCIDQ